MHVVLAGLIWEAVIVYLDDINVLDQEPRKCALFRHEMVFLGRVVDKDGVRMSREDIKAV